MPARQARKTWPIQTNKNNKAKKNHPHSSEQPTGFRSPSNTASNDGSFGG
jgi:hypothetical protein